jgi:hypothetical protein
LGNQELFTSDFGPLEEPTIILLSRMLFTTGRKDAHPCGVVLEPDDVKDTGWLAALRPINTGDWFRILLASGVFHDPITTPTIYSSSLMLWK